MGVKADDSSASSTSPEVHDSVATSPQSSIIISPPIALDRNEIYNTGLEAKQKGLVYQVLDILKTTSDLASFQVPVPINLPKSQLQCYGEQVFCSKQDLLGPCADGQTPLDRFVAVVRWHISLVRPVPFAKAPYNPILGETHHVTAGDLNLITEQVSHHPPVSALYATNSKRKIEILQWNFSQPKFYGNSVSVGVGGRRTLTLLVHGEIYETTSPALTFRFWPGVVSEWTGDTMVKCAQTGLEAVVSFKSKSYFSTKGNQVSGKIFRTSSQQNLYTLSGSWDESVMLEGKGGKKSVLYNGKVNLTNIKTAVVENPRALSPTESVVVWSQVTKGVWNQDWEAARAAKTSVEETQRALRKQREKAGETWKPKYFNKLADGGWEWALKDKPVPPAPIKWQK
ncbi:unnamed protein product [Calypogeia fissa]